MDVVNIDLSTSSTAPSKTRIRLIFLQIQKLIFSPTTKEIIKQFCLHIRVMLHDSLNIQKLSDEAAASIIVQ